VNQALAMGDQGTQHPDRFWGHPNFGDHGARQEERERQRVTAIGFDGKRHPGVGLAGFGDNHACDQRAKHINPAPGGGATFQDDMIRQCQMLGRPRSERRRFHTPRRQDDLFVRPNGTDNNVLFVDIQGHKAEGW
jgi:hypothetical protein